ncbi:hypothetical protein H8L32_23970 [Undibacterium sp. CY18W]|uniref:Lipocalin-like domain-containing protein n=1 Tax=Undibacterium hunanense TaxID=2762292 RepID=A0ABR6ZXZ9_9BURK|nr:hypothetical protein [Undibacterium hunanense]MBC3920543.1 hypothetical protein [Undibacterium hunanense]
MKLFHSVITVASLVVCSLAPALLAHAKVPQQLSAKIDGKLFESDDDGITYLIPTKGVLNLIASTKGASAYPPPKTLTDRLSIICRSFEGKPVKYQARDFGNNGCEVKFIKGESKQPFGEPVAEYDARDGKNMLEITTVSGKVIEGKFSFELKDKKTKAVLMITEGTFKAEDRQM